MAAGRKITVDIVAAVKRRLALGHRPSEIARDLKIGVRTLSRIRAGKWSEGKVKRCPTCGHVGKIPCLICQARLARMELDKARLAKKAHSTNSAFIRRGMRSH